VGQPKNRREKMANTLPLPIWKELSSLTSGGLSNYYGKWYSNQDYYARMLMNESQNTSNQVSGENTFNLIKKSIKQIKAEAVGEEAQKIIGNKIQRLKKLGVTAQAQVLEIELNLRIRLARVQEWDYKVLPYDAIKDYDGKIYNSYTLKVHIDQIDKYCGQDEQTEAKDKIIPDFVLDKLEESREKQVFDDFSVLWIEKVKDPLLLGSIKGCKDYFLIAEWGEDVKFNDLVNPEKQEAK
jgi:hypothetical protein